MSTTEIIRIATEAAQNAFWDSLSKDFPNAKAGKDCPQRTVDFDNACKTVVSEWLFFNDETSPVSVPIEDFLMPNMEPTLCISTAHIPLKSAIALGQPDVGIESAELYSLLSYVAWSNYGWIIFCSKEASDSIEDKHPELASLISLCVSRNISYLKLDCDGLCLPENLVYPYFNW